MELGCLAGLWPSILIHLILLFSISNTRFPPAANCLGNLGNETDQLALLEFKARIFSDPYGILNSWNDSANFCTWQGVTCGNNNKRVTLLDLQGMSLMGTLSPYISNLTFLRFLSLANNRFHGEIPQQVGYLFRLRYLNLTINTFEGEIPANISYCLNLRIMDLGSNNLTGKIPAELGFLNRLVTIYLGKNKLTGEIPHSLGNLSSLQQFSVGFNTLQGNISNDLGRLTSLTLFYVSANNLTGTIPSTLYNLSSVAHFSFAANQLEGTLPLNIGLTLPNLLRFSIGVNQIHGSIPSSLTNASRLQLLDISYNKLTGQVPNNLGYLNSLQWLNMEVNFLGSNTSKDMDFMTSLSNCSNLGKFSINENNFGGLLPSSIANMSTLADLRIAGNQIYGNIPSKIGNLVNLYSLHLSDNLISGPIPDSLGRLVNLQALTMYQNKLSGEIPQSLCNNTRLSLLALYGNKLEGNITSMGNCKNLQYLDISANNLFGSIPKQIFYLFPLVFFNLSQNALTGLIPVEVGSLKNINELDMSENKLSGEIPKSIGECLSLELLYLGGNMLQGNIPTSLATLKGLQDLDLSRNNLSGNIPTELEKLMFLRYLNLSSNNLKGEVPKKGVFSNASAFSLDGDSNLCGGIPELQLPPCPVKGKKHRKSTKTIILAAIISPVVIFITIIFAYVFYPRKSTKDRSSELSNVDKLPQISYRELLQATRDFSSENIIGEGSFGTVYKGNLDPKGERSVAVKVLKLQQHGASKSFLAECNALHNIRHRNLVKILTCCSSIDHKGNDFKALVFDFMENGSLEMWLHPNEDGSSQPRNLSLLQRLQVAIDMSSAIHYLHDNCEIPIVHCDLKPSNILFDSEMTAHVGDFGLARFLSEPTNNFSQGETSSTGIKGTIGYMAPEYGVGSQATKYGDIYSFGIILLEIFTGRRPTDQIFTNGVNLHNFVKANLPRRVMQLLDPVLITAGNVASATTASEIMEDDDAIVESLRKDEGDVHKCIVSVLEIGLSCSAELPQDRIHMRDVNRKINLITEAFVRTMTRRGKQIVAY